MYILLKDLKEKNPQILKGYYSCEERTEKGKYLLAYFTDVSGERATYLIKSTDFSYNIFKNMPHCYCQCEVNYLGVGNGYKQYKLNKIKPLMDPNKGVLSSIPKLQEKLLSYINSINDPLFKKITMDAYQDNKDFISKCPASMLTGYSYEGGLLAQTVRVCDLAMLNYNYYTNTNYNTDGVQVPLNYDALICGAVLSDMGSINYYKLENNKVLKTLYGRLVDKEYMCMFFYLTYLLELFKVDIEKFILLFHILINTNSKRYNVSTPQTPEAEILASIKEMDKRYANYEYASRVPTTEDFVKVNGRNYCLFNFDCCKDNDESCPEAN